MRLITSKEANRASPRLSSSCLNPWQLSVREASIDTPPYFLTGQKEQDGEGSIGD